MLGNLRFRAKVVRSICILSPSNDKLYQVETPHTDQKHT